MADMEIHEKLQRVLEARGISQAELARRTGLPQPSVNEWVNGKRGLSLKQARKLALALEVSLDILADSSDRTIPDPLGEREKQVREIAGRLGWDWIYWRLLEAQAGADKSGTAITLAERDESVAYRRMLAEKASDLEPKAEDKGPDVPGPPERR